MRLLRRLKAYRCQIRKERSDVWMPRLALARRGCWDRLNARMADGTFTEWDLGHFERHMTRLGRLTLPASRADHVFVATFFYMPITLFPQLPRQPTA